MKSTILSLAAFAALATAVQAGDPYTGFTDSIDRVSLYNAHELQFDVFGTYAFTEPDDSAIFRDDTVGGGIGVNYFFTRHLGIGGEGMLFDTEGDTMGSTAANLFLRAPIGDSGLAFYGFAGVGFLFNADHLDEDDFEDARDRADDDVRGSASEDVLFEGHVGLGAEMRFSQHFGIFTDIRHTFVESDDSDYTSARAGVRFSF